MYKLSLLVVLLVMAMTNTCLGSPIIPEPKIPLREQDTIDYENLKKAKDMEKLRALVKKHALEYYDKFVDDFKALNKTDKSPLGPEVRNSFDEMINKQPDSAYLEQTNIDLLKFEHNYLKGLVMNSYKKEKIQISNEKVTENHDILYLIGVMIASLGVVVYSLKGKKS